MAKLNKSEQSLLDNDEIEKTIGFTITINGTGHDAEEAWQDALEGFMNDVGIMDEEDITSVEKTEEDDEAGV